MTWVIVISFVVTLVLGIPLAVVLGATGFITLIFMGIPLEVVAQRMFTGIDSFPLMAVPFFYIGRRPHE